MKTPSTELTEALDRVQHEVTAARKAGADEATVRRAVESQLNHLRRQNAKVPGSG